MLIKMRVFAYLENKIFLQGVSEGPEQAGGQDGVDARLWVR